MKALGILLSVFMLFLPPVPLRAAEHYSVDFIAPDSVEIGTDFTVTVITKNISGKTLYTNTSSTYYKKGALIEIYQTQPDGHKIYLQHNMMFTTMDLRCQQIEIGETMRHTWTFSTRTRDNQPVPQGVYNLEIREIGVVESFILLV